MKQYIKMVTVLTAITAVCGFLLATVKDFTAESIEQQILVNVKGPALKKVLATSTNDILQDRMEVDIDGKKQTLFIGKKEDKAWAVAFESSGGGFGGDIGVMVGFDLDKDQIIGIGILTHQETPGLGARITEPGFAAHFKDKPITTVFKVKKDNGDIDAISGATNSSRGVCEAVTRCIEVYPKIKAQVTGNQK